MVYIKAKLWYRIFHFVRIFQNRASLTFILLSIILNNIQRHFIIILHFKMKKNKITFSYKYLNYLFQFHFTVSEPNIPSDGYFFAIIFAMRLPTPIFSTILRWFTHFMTTLHSGVTRTCTIQSNPWICLPSPRRYQTYRTDSKPKVLSL